MLFQMAAAGCVTVLEPTGLSHSDGKQRDGVTVLPYERGLPLAWDATITHTCAQSYVQATAVRAEAAAAATEKHKESKYACLEARVAFSAVAFKISGLLGLPPPVFLTASLTASGCAPERQEHATASTDASPRQCSWGTLRALSRRTPE